MMDVVGDGFWEPLRPAKGPAESTTIIIAGILILQCRNKRRNT